MGGSPRDIFKQKIGLALFWLLWPGALAAEARLIGVFDWTEDWAGFGGFSAIEVSEDGQEFLALSDRALLVEGRLQREGGVVTGVTVTDRAQVLDLDGTVMPMPRGDSEGLALARAGRIFLSFEGVARVWVQDGLQGPPRGLPRADGFAGLPRNGALESLAIAPDGSIWTIPERSGRADLPFEVFRFADRAWTVAWALPRRGSFLPAGADFGPDGRLYLLERDFTGWGFRSRIRRFAPDGSGEEVVLETATGVHDNLEGISVWQDADGLRITMISDDNFRFLQQTQIVEYRLD
jgi:hypothetical protein